MSFIQNLTMDYKSGVIFGDWNGETLTRKVNLLLSSSNAVICLYQENGVDSAE